VDPGRRFPSAAAFVAALANACGLDLAGLGGAGPRPADHGTMTTAPEPRRAAVAGPPAAWAVSPSPTGVPEGVTLSRSRLAAAAAAVVVIAGVAGFAGSQVASWAAPGRGAPPTDAGRGAALAVAAVGRASLPATAGAAPAPAPAPADAGSRGDPALVSTSRGEVASSPVPAREPAREPARAPERAPEPSAPPLPRAPRTLRRLRALESVAVHVPDVDGASALSRRVTSSADFAVGGVRGAGDALPAGGEARVYRRVDVDRPATPATRFPEPRYPSTLRSEGVEGAVVAVFVVDSTGGVVPSSVRVAQSAHPALAQAVREVLRTGRFVPAELAGRRVAQQVEQRFEFRLTR
jgi:TonB family protein